MPQTKAIDEPQIWHVYLSQDIDTTDRALKGRRIGFLSPYLIEKYKQIHTHPGL